MFSEKVRQHVTINFVPENIIVVVVGPVDRVCVEINDVIDVQSSIVMRTGNRETVRMRATRAQVVVVAISEHSAFVVAMNVNASSAKATTNVMST
jgi:hypothetical protein